MKKINNEKTSIKIDNSLDEYKTMPIFQDKVDKANIALKRIGLPKFNNNNNNKTIEQLEKEIDDLSTKLIDLTFELNYNKEKELLELVREIYKSINEELVCKESRLTKKQILMNIKRYLEEFAKNTKLKL
jgi:small-conductance mechanosensitive channel